MIKTHRLTRIWCDACKISNIASEGYDFTVAEARAAGWIIGKSKQRCPDCQPPKYPGGKE